MAWFTPTSGRPFIVCPHISPKIVLGPMELAFFEKEIIQPVIPHGVSRCSSRYGTSHGLEYVCHCRYRYRYRCANILNS